MLFNTWFGQMRPLPNQPGKFYFRPKMPVGKIQLRKLGKYNTQYVADKRGNMEVLAHEHIKDFIGLGYPIYNGMFIGETTREDLIWPDNPEYNRRVMAGLSQIKEA